MLKHHYATGDGRGGVEFETFRGIDSCSGVEAVALPSLVYVVGNQCFTDSTVITRIIITK